MMYVLRLAHTPEYMAKVLLAIADAFLELGRFPGTAWTHSMVCAGAHRYLAACVIRRDQPRNKG